MKICDVPILLLLTMACSGALAQYKCVDAKGSTSFQQTPCPAANKEQKIRVFVGEAQLQAVHERDRGLVELGRRLPVLVRDHDLRLLRPVDLLAQAVLEEEQLQRGLAV